LPLPEALRCWSAARSAGIAAQVEHQPLHPLPRQRFEGSAQVLVGALGEVGDADIAGLVVNHEDGREARDADLVAHHGHGNQLVEPLASDADVHERALGPAQLAHRIVRCPALGRLSLDLGNHVPAANALGVRGRALEDPHGRDTVRHGLNGDAQTEVPALLAFAHLLVAARIHETRMRVERLQHPADGPVDQLVRLDRLDVLALDGGQRRCVDAVAIGDRVLRRGHTGSKPSPDHRRRGEGQHHGKTRLHTHTAMLANNPPPGKEFRGAGVYSPRKTSPSGAPPADLLLE